MNMARALPGRRSAPGRPCVNHDIAKGGPWQQAGREAGVVAAVAVPLIKAGQSVGVVMFFVGKSWAADEEIIALLARIAENVSFALDNFERANAKAKADEQKKRLTRMFAALSATNEAIMRAKSRTEMFELVCEAAAQGGRFNSTSILLVRPDSDFFDMVAAAGPTADNARRLKVSIDETRSGRARALRDGVPYAAGLHHQRFSRPIRERRRSPQIIHTEGARSGAAFPLLIDGQPVGVMLFISAETDTFTAEFAELLQRLADNVSFALGSFDRADEKAKTEEQKERLTRMFAALGATNEAIMRAKSRTELFELVCEAATVGGNFTSTAIVLDRPGADFLRKCRFRRTRSGAGQQGAIVGRCGEARRAGHHRHRVPYAPAVHQQRLSGRFRQLRAFLSRWFATAGPDRVRRCRCCRTAKPSAPLCSSPANSARSAPN